MSRALWIVVDAGIALVALGIAAYAALVTAAFGEFAPEYVLPPLVVGIAAVALTAAQAVRWPGVRVAQPLFVVALVAAVAYFCTAPAR